MHNLNIIYKDMLTEKNFFYLKYEILTSQKTLGIGSFHTFITHEFFRKVKSILGMLVLFLSLGIINNET